MKLVLPDRWRTRGPHPVHRLQDYRTPSHEHALVFYNDTPLTTLGAVLLFVHDHPGWHARKVAGKWVAVR